MYLFFQLMCSQNLSKRPPLEEKFNNGPHWNRKNGLQRRWSLFRVLNKLQILVLEKMTGLNRHVVSIHGWFKGQVLLDFVPKPFEIVCSFGQRVVKEWYVRVYNHTLIINTQTWWLMNRLAVKYSIRLMCLSETVTSQGTDSITETK